MFAPKKAGAVVSSYAAVFAAPVGAVSLSGRPNESYVYVVEAPFSLSVSTIRPRPGWRQTRVEFCIASVVVVTYTPSTSSYAYLVIRGSTGVDEHAPKQPGMQPLMQLEMQAPAFTPAPAQDAWQGL